MTSATTLNLIPPATEPLVSYAYSYPHKSSYTPLVPAIPLQQIWHNEDQQQLALYLHIPFCEMRCGFCNLLAQSQPADELITSYLVTLDRQMQVIRRELPAARFAQFAIGGGTPTLLSAAELDQLFRQLQRILDVEPARCPTSVETSPATATPERLQLLADAGVERISLGVQSFVESEARSLGRPQRLADVHEALTQIRARNFPVLNIDLIYGADGQTHSTWQTSLQQALDYQPEELYLYPLYIRPDTGLSRIDRQSADNLTALYRSGRQVLLHAGYRQLSLRCFQKPQLHRETEYSCQQDGMVGLGCGARSYTSRLHYATRFATTQAGIKTIVGDWIRQSDADLALATHGYQLDRTEQQRRHVILSILQTSGLSLTSYQQRFGSDCFVDVPELLPLLEADWLELNGDLLRLTETGLEMSDTIGPSLYSAVVRERLRRFVER